MDSLSLLFSSTPLLKPNKSNLKNPQIPFQIPLSSSNPKILTPKTSAKPQTSAVSANKVFTSFTTHDLSSKPLNRTPKTSAEKENSANSANKVVSFVTHDLSSKPVSNPPKPKTSPKLHLSIPIIMGFLYSSNLPSLASEIIDPSSQRINLETILVSIDNFFIKYPYSVAGVTFIWLIVIPLLEDYFEKFQFISALNAFKKLRDDSSVQLLDIRDDKSLGFLGSPNLRIFNKNVVNVTFNEGDEDGFLMKVKAKFLDPQNTIVCILDNFDGNSLKVAELLFKNGFKEAYAIKGGVRGKKGWQEIQEEFFPPAVHVFRRKKGQKSPQAEENGAATLPDVDQLPAAASDK